MLNENCDGYLFLFTEAKKRCPPHFITRWADGVENNFAWLLKAGEDLLRMFVSHSTISGGAMSHP